MRIENVVTDDSWCRGCYLATLDEGPRIRLPRAMAATLQKHKVRRLWCYQDPTGQRLILCPEEHRNMYTELAKAHFPADMDRELAYRQYICSAECKELGNHPRIGITTSLHEQFPVNIRETVIIVGVGLWYEVWRQDDWDGGAEA